MNTKNKITKVVGKVIDSKIVENMPTGDALKFFNSLAEAYKEDQITKRELAKVEATKKVLLTEIKEKYAFYREVFDKIFQERKTIIEKNFELIDKGIQSNNNEIILKGIEALNQVVSSSPFANIGALKNALENNKQIEI